MLIQSFSNFYCIIISKSPYKTKKKNLLPIVKHVVLQGLPCQWKNCYAEKLTNVKIKFKMKTSEGNLSYINFTATLLQ